MGKTKSSPSPNQTSAVVSMVAVTGIVGYAT